MSGQDQDDPGVLSINNGGNDTLLRTSGGWRVTTLQEQEQAVIDAARLFVMSTSYYRQRKESREAFERLAFALLDLRKAIDADS